ncbi:Fur family transcriptional regulator [Hylemonella sp. W303a]|uniref:Fur family transcriptional regulator n=1 Tax=Hylemonella sp. W303a TaxID=3389873 RepID=UPI00396B3638
MPESDDAIDLLLAEHGLRKTHAAREVLRWLRRHQNRDWAHGELLEALRDSGGIELDRVTLYRLLDRLTQVGLLVCHVDAERVRHYRAVSDAVESHPRFECQACHRNFELTSGATQLEQAARSALKALESVGHHGLSVNLSVRGVCADCSPGAPAGRR